MKQVEQRKQFILVLQYLWNEVGISVRPKNGRRTA